MDIPEALNADFIDAQYRLWITDPGAVSKDWRFFFAGFAFADGRRHGDDAGPDPVRVRAVDQAKVEALKYRYRDLGHLLACMDPLETCPIDHPLLELSAFGLSLEDLDQPFFTRRQGENTRVPLKEIIRHLKATYCRSVGVEYLHIQDPAERQWLQDRMEPVENAPKLTDADRLRILFKLQQAAVFENFLNKKYLAVTRFSLEGGDVVIPMLDALTDHLAAKGCRHIVLGMAHRGRLNVQTHVLGKPYTEIFSEFESCYDPESLMGAGDVKYHNGYLADVTTAGGHALRILLANNPSHLEAVSPVAEGMARALQDAAGADAADRVVPVLLHGDAAFAGQGVVFETLNMSQLSGYGTGGTVHLIINNQIGYTTLPHDARSTRYATDGAKMLMAPVFHVHGENPEAAVHVIRLAADYRLTFHKDVVIDVVCYRRYGHNEGDEPYFTQPRMYDRIKNRPPVDRLYAEQLMADGKVDPDRISADADGLNQALTAAYEEIHGSSCLFPQDRFFENWAGISGTYTHEPVDTGVSARRITDLARRLNHPPEDFTVNPKLTAVLNKRLSAVEQGTGIDWANAESLAFASLLTEGTPIRLSGQDSGRGTFAQRHSVIFDTITGEAAVPLNRLEPGQAAFQVHNSLLAEYAVLGFEYGYSVIRPETLTLWEAQFGDFVNNAQSVIDLFIASGQSKWQRLSGLTLLLPHGFEGLGPEHSSARPERFLQLCAEDNLQVCNLTTPAQYFHLLRRQARAPYRKPLVLFTPKSLLRHPLAVSTVADLSKGRFSPVMDDPPAGKSPKRVLVCAGKIFYELLQRRKELKLSSVAIVRIEQLYPFPEGPMEKIAGKYKRAAQWCWVQEEPENMGAWQFIRPRLEAAVGKPVTYIGRPAASSPATGFPRIYRRQQAAITDQAVGPAPVKKDPAG